MQNFNGASEKKGRVIRREITSSLITVVSCFIQEYLTRSFERERTPKDVVAEIADGIGDDLKSLWLFLDSSEVVRGFAFASVMYSELGSKIVNIHHLFIENVDRSLIHEFDVKVGEWGKYRGATEVGFYTRRNPKAFIRRIKNGWEFDSYILKRKI